MNIWTVRFFAFLIWKVWWRIYDQIIINHDQLLKLKELMNKNEGNVVLCPTHRSYVDFLIVSYVLFHSKMEVPFICAGEDFLNMAVVHHILRWSGAFFMKRTFKDDPLYKAIFNAYVSKLLEDGFAFEFFVEGTRSWTGKMLKPKFGLLTVLLDNFYDRRVENLHFVPININYSRTLEGESFPGELLGEEKLKESTGRLLKAWDVLKINFG